MSSTTDFAMALEPIYADSIAFAMEMRTDGKTPEAIYSVTGVTSLDLTLAEHLGIAAYPVRPTKQINSEVFRNDFERAEQS